MVAPCVFHFSCRHGHFCMTYVSFLFQKQCDLRLFPVLSVFMFRLSRLFCSAVPFLSAVRLFVDIFGSIDGFGLGFFVMPLRVVLALLIPLYEVFD